MHSNRMSILWFWGVVFYIYLGGPTHRMVLKAPVSLLIFCLGDPSTAESRVLRSLTINILLSICLFILVKSWLLYLAPPLLGA